MKRWFLRIQISHFLRFAMSLAKLMIAVSLPLARVILQGCGGEEEEATTVAQNATTNIVTNCEPMLPTLVPFAQPCCGRSLV